MAWYNVPKITRNEVVSIKLPQAKKWYEFGQAPDRNNKGIAVKAAQAMKKA